MRIVKDILALIAFLFSVLNGFAAWLFITMWAAGSGKNDARSFLMLLLGICFGVAAWKFFTSDIEDSLPRALLISIAPSVLFVLLMVVPDLIF